MLRIGTPAPDFEVLLRSKLRFRLSDHQGKRIIVLSFLPKSQDEFTTREKDIFLEHVREIRAKSAILLTISDDTSRRLLRKEGPEEEPFLSADDPNYEVCRNYRVLWLGGKAIRRVTYVIDKRGIIRGVAHHELLVERHWSFIRRVLEKLFEEDELENYNRSAGNL